MCNKTWILVCLLLMLCYLVMTMEAAVVQVKKDMVIPMPTLPPPKKTPTFDDDKSWCVALPGASEVDLQRSLDWVCGQKMVDCNPINPGGPCFDPDTLVSHASFAYNSYFQLNGGTSDLTCNFGGTATLTKKNPNHGECVYVLSSGHYLGSSAAPSTKFSPGLFWWRIGGFLLFLHLINSY